MAEGGISFSQQSWGQPKINSVCRYFLHGSCSKGENCRYVHDRTGTVPSDNICRYYQLGKCSYGQHCRYDHVKREKDQVRQQTSPAPTQPRSAKPAQPQANTRRRAASEQRQSQMVTLGKGRNNGGTDYKHMQKKKAKDAKWAQAKSFVPGQKYCGACPSSYAAAIGGNDSQDQEPVYYMGTAIGCKDDSRGGPFDDGRGGMPLQLVTAETPLCPFYAAGGCHDNDDCPYVHGDICDMCGLPQLHPANKRQQAEHRRECLADHEREMEKAFAVAASEDKECGICLESVLHKISSTGSYSDTRFGILENCNHCFCLSCIRQWRGHKEETMEMQRTCPTCRVHSNFIVPSKYWVETPEEKGKLFEDYRNAVKAKPCRYFSKGKGFCPFNSKCFYLHALADGTVVEENVIKPRRRTNADGETTLAEDYSLWSFLEDRDDTMDDLLLRVRDLMRDDFGDDFSDSDLSGGLYLYYDSSSSDDY